MEEGGICMDRDIIRNIGGVIRNSADVPRGKGPESYQVAMKVAGMAADAGLALFAIAQCIRLMGNILKGKK